MTRMCVVTVLLSVECGFNYYFYAPRASTFAIRAFPQNQARTVLMLVNPCKTLTGKHVLRIERLNMPAAG